jgi:D-alanyl-D-alanine carboxypeptidase (penicillin-binding protein 5/6)
MLKTGALVGLACITLWSGSGLNGSTTVHASDTAGLAPNSKSFVLMDAATGTVLYEKNMHRELPPASITKMMTMLLTMEAIDSGRLKWTDTVTASAYAASMGGSQIYLEPGEKMSVRDIFKGVVIASGNDAAVAIAEKIGGSEKQFVAMMNAKAQALGLKNTHFSNVNGLPIANHYTSAYDIAMIGEALLKHPEVLKFTGTYEDYIRRDTKKPLWLVNSNKLLKYYKGTDGLKTGYTSEAGSCLAATAVRHKIRLIAVVLGEPHAKQRNQEVMKLLDYAFEQYTNKIILKKGTALGKIHVAGANPGTLKVHATKNFSVLVRKQATGNTSYTTKVTWAKGLKAPIQKGQPIGTLQIMEAGKVIVRTPVLAPQKMVKSSFMNDLKYFLYNLVMP